LCRTWSNDESRNGLEIVLKGGQIGDETFFGQAQIGDAAH
jgi:uncharacterized protein YgbK (DUF1537 family)